MFIDKKIQYLKINPSSQITHGVNENPIKIPKRIYDGI